MAGESPATGLVSALRVQNVEVYQHKLGVLGDIDHIVPLSMFDLTIPNEIALAWSLDNVRRIPTEANRNRGASIEAAYLALLSSNWVFEDEYKGLVNKVEPLVRSMYPCLKIEKVWEK